MKSSGLSCCKVVPLGVLVLRSMGTKEALANHKGACGHTLDVISLRKGFDGNRIG